MSKPVKKKKNKVLQEGLKLANSKWSKYTRAIVEGYKRNHGQKPNSNLISTTAIMLENTDKMIKKMDETTRVVNLGNFVDYGFGIITAVMPSLVANEIVSVQPLKARTGEIFYLDFKYGSNKGDIEQGESMISPFTGTTGETNYTSEHVDGDEFASASSTGSSVTVSGSLSYLPVRPGSVEITDGTTTYVDDEDGNIVVDNGDGGNYEEGTVDYDSGRVEMEFSSLDSDIQLVATYDFNYANQDVGATIPEVNIELASKSITTTSRKLRARWLFDAAYELQQTHGVDADAELSTAMAAEVRHEIDGEVMKDLLSVADAGETVFEFDKTPPDGVPMVDHKDAFVDHLITMSNAIFQDTKRAEGNFIVGGIQVCSLIESMGGRFVPETDGIKAGPHIVGTLDGRWKVVKNPYYPSDEFLVGYKGNSYLEGGYIYAPYLPLYTTPTVMLDDFVNRKGVATRYGKKVINPKFFARGRVA